MYNQNKERIDKASIKVLKAMAKTEKTEFINFLRLSKLFKADGEEAPDLSWVPQCIGDKSRPIGHRTFGAPFVLSSRKWGLRYGPEFLMYPGIGCMLFGVEGEATVVLWPMANTLKRGAAVKEAVAMIENMNLNNKQVCEYMSDASFTPLKVKSERSLSETISQSPPPPKMCRIFVTIVSKW